MHVRDDLCDYRRKHSAYSQTTDQWAISPWSMLNAKNIRDEKGHFCLDGLSWKSCQITILVVFESIVIVQIFQLYQIVVRIHNS